MALEDPVLFSVLFLFSMFLAHVLSLKVEIITKKIVLPPNGDGIPRACNFWNFPNVKIQFFGVSVPEAIKATAQ